MGHIILKINIYLILFAVITLLLSLQIPELTESLNRILILLGLISLLIIFSYISSRVIPLFKRKIEIISTDNPNRYESSEDITFKEYLHWQLFTFQPPISLAEWIASIFCGVIIILIFILFAIRLINGNNNIEMFYFWKGFN